MQEQNSITPSMYSHKEMEALLYGAKSILQHQDFEGAAKQIFNTCKNLIGATAGYIALLSEDGCENEVLFLDPGDMNCTVNPSLPMPIRGLRERAYRLCKPVYDNDFSTSQWMQFLPEGHVPLKNVLFAPLIHGGKAVGLMGMSNKAGGFDDHDAELSSAFSEYAAIALYNSRNLQKLTHIKTELEQLNTELEQKVQERTKEITALLKQKDDFIQNLAHDLKNPLGPLITILPVLKEVCDKPKYCDMLEVLSRNVDYMKNLVQKTIELGQLHSPNYYWTTEKIQVHSFIDTIIKSYTSTKQDKQIEIINNTTEGLCVLANKKRFEEVIRYLIDNALTYRNESCLITIETLKKNLNIIFSVKDNGIGLNDFQKAHVFDEFYKADDSRHEFTNTGLGLSITKCIIEKHGGNIWVESKGIGKGCNFFFTLPSTDDP